MNRAVTYYTLGRYNKMLLRSRAVLPTLEYLDEEQTTSLTMYLPSISPTPKADTISCTWCRKAMVKFNL